MKVHDLQPAPGSNRRSKRVGRGIAGKGGKTAGRGTKGQKARGTIPAAFEGGQMPLHMRVPKLKGFTNPFRVEYQALNLDTLEASEVNFTVDRVPPEFVWCRWCSPHEADHVVVVGREIGAKSPTDQSGCACDCYSHETRARALLRSLLIQVGS